MLQRRRPLLLTLPGATSCDWDGSLDRAATTVAVSHRLCDGGMHIDDQVQDLALVEGKRRLLASALALLAATAGAVGVLAGTGLTAASASAPPATTPPASTAVSNLSTLVAHAKAKELSLLDQVQTARKTLAAERAEIQQARSQLASLISAEYTGASSGLLELLASNSLDQALNTQITLSRLTAAEKSALQQLGASVAAERGTEKALVVAQQAATVTEKRLQAEEIVAAFEAANPPPSAPSSATSSTGGALQGAASPRAGATATSTPPAPSPSSQPTPSRPAPSPTPTNPPPSPNPSPAVGQFSVNTNLTQPSGITVSQIQQFLQGTPLEADSSYFMTAQATSHVSAIYLISDAVLETGWGTSQLYLVKHNLFGFEAYDLNPFGDGATFPSDQACISYVSWFVSVNYLTPPGYQVANYPGQSGQVPTGQYYNGPTPTGMNVDYASDPLWATKIAEIGDLLQSTPG